MKSLGFKLFGNLIDSGGEIDPDKAFEIHFFPGITPFGTLAHFGRHDEKTILVELPEEMKENNFEKICSYLMEKNAQLVVKELGFEKLGNRKLHLEIGNPHEMIVNINVFIQGKYQAFNYEIELNPYDLSCSTGEINYKKAHLNIKELLSLKNGEVSKVLSRLKPNNFKVSIEGNEIHVELGAPLKQYIDGLGKPSKYQTQKSENHYSAYPDEIAADSPQSTLTSVWRKLIGK
ncbi:MAG: hypothetical protein LW832_08965 [Parachlamydia sp.]|jgi:hypothetical protein|nr:hypothetical protein [Parachlamydia sp.]